jgi:hypothetical protein
MVPCFRRDDVWTPVSTGVTVFGLWTLLAIQKAPEVLIVGTRSTASLAHHFWFGLTKLEIKATRILSITTETYDYINRLDRRTCLLFIGFPRYLREIIDLLDFSKEKGLRTIILTDSPFSPLQGEINHYYGKPHRFDPGTPRGRAALGDELGGHDHGQLQNVPGSGIPDHESRL